MMSELKERVIISNRFCMKVKNREKRKKNCLECENFSCCNQLVKENQERIIKKLKMNNYNHWLLKYD